MTPTLANAIADVRRALIEFWLDAGDDAPRSARREHRGGADCRAEG